ncbi:YIP1 family protein [Candidatus Pacearchaeota archaeon]|nr:YIP1 family protein [Candidatus Pacearchaeota archaeon]
MVNKNLVNYLNEGKKRGFSLSLLKNKLSQGGFRPKEIEEAAKYVEMNSVSNVEKNINGEIGIFGKFWKAIAHPKTLFEVTKNEGVWPALKYQLVISIIPFVIYSLLGILLSSFVISLLNGSSLSGFSTNYLAVVLFFLIGFFIVFPIGIFVLSGVMYLFVKIYRGQGGFKEMYKVFVYSSTPVLFLGFIPIVNFAVGLWQFILMIFGLSIQHNFSKLRAFLALITPSVVIIILVWVVYLLLA